MRRSNLIKSLLLTASLAWLGTSAEAAISVPVGGVPTITFDTAPGAGEWSTRADTVAGAVADLTTPAAMLTAVRTNSAGAFNVALASVAGAAPIAAARLPQYSSVGQHLTTRITGPAYQAVMATLQNDTGGDVTSMDLSYDLGVLTTVAEQVTGHIVVYSFTGLPGSWNHVPNLSPTLSTNIMTTNAAGVSTKSITWDLSATPWGVNSTMYLMWVDDNGSGSPDNAQTIDNFAIANVVSVVPQPPSIATHPVTTTVNERGTVSLTVSASGALTYQWTLDGVDISNANTNFHGNAVVISGATTPTLTINNAALGLGGVYRCRVANNVGPVTSNPATLTVTPDTAAPRLLYAFVNQRNPLVVYAVLSEPLDESAGDVTDTFHWALNSVAPAAALSLTGILYTNGATLIEFDLDAGTPIAPDVEYSVKLADAVGLPEVDTSAARNAMPANTEVLVTRVVTLAKSWSYLDTDIDPGAGWQASGFVDAGWATGPGPFDAKRDQPTAGGHCRTTTVNDLGNVGTCINLTSPVTMTNLITAYFRTHFTYSGGGALNNTFLYLRGKFDDGGAVYLNGVEVWRIGLPAGAGHSTLANRTVGDTDAQDALLAFSPALVVGDNVLAVEAHQVNLTSSDLTMGLSVDVVKSTGIQFNPTLSITEAGGSVTVTWGPAQGQLQYKDNLEDASWTLVTPAPAAGGPYVVPVSQAHRFYSIKQ